MRGPGVRSLRPDHDRNPVTHYTDRRGPVRLPGIDRLVNSKRLRRLLYLPNRVYRRLLPQRIRRLVLIPPGLIAVGTFGYPLIEGPPWTYFDGFYMTVITLTTVGYGEIPEPLSKPGRLFTVVLALGGIFLFFYIVTDLVSSVIDGGLRELLGRERVNEQMQQLRGHLIVCGFGRMGKNVCDELERLGHPFVVIDTPSRGPAAPWDYRHGLRLSGDATEDDVLREAGIDRAKALIAAVGADSANLYISLSARLLNPEMTLVARCEDEGAGAKLLKIGVDIVISPYLASGLRAVQSVLEPTPPQFTETAAREAFGNALAADFRIAHESPLAGKTLREANLAEEYGVAVVGVLEPDGKAIPAPNADTVLEPGSIVIVYGVRDNLARVAGLAAAP